MNRKHDSRISWKIVVLSALGLAIFGSDARAFDAHITPMIIRDNTAETDDNSRVDTTSLALPDPAAAPTDPSATTTDSNATTGIGSIVDRLGGQRTPIRTGGTPAPADP